MLSSTHVPSLLPLFCLQPLSFHPPELSTCLYWYRIVSTVATCSCSTRLGFLVSRQSIRQDLSPTQRPICSRTCSDLGTRLPRGQKGSVVVCVWWTTGDLWRRGEQPVETVLVARDWGSGRCSCRDYEQDCSAVSERVREGVQGRW